MEAGPSKGKAEASEAEAEPSGAGEPQGIGDETSAHGKSVLF